MVQPLCPLHGSVIQSPTPPVQVLYNLFEWPTLPGARLSVVGISNTHDLDSRVLPRIARCRGKVCAECRAKCVGAEPNG